MGAVRFEGVDILDSLGQIMELHTQHYKDDFDLDKELIPKLALSGEPEDRRLLWLSRPCGTYTLREWEVYLEGSHANKVWEFYHEQTKDPVLAYALSTHHPKGKIERYRKICSCRKPNTGLLEAANRDFRIDMEHSYLAGDRAGDILAGINAGLRTILLESGYGSARLEAQVRPDYFVQDLRDVIAILQ